MNGSPILLVGAGKMGAGYLDAAARRDARLHVAEFPAFASRTRAVADRVTVPSAMLEESWYAAALEALGGERPGAVVAFSEAHVLAAALIQDAFGLPGPGLHAAVVSRNKALQRAVFGAAGVAQPAYTLVPDAGAGIAWADGRFPVILKPVGESGSVGVEVVPGRDGMLAAAARRTDPGRVLVEEVVEGPEFSVECLVRDGEPLFCNITAKETTGPPHFVEVCHRAGHEPVGVESFVRAVLAGLRMETGVVHLEFRLAPGLGPVLMEVAVRSPGDFIMDVVSMTWGFDMFEAVLALALGEKPPLPAPDDPPVAYAASRFLFARPGILERVDGLDEVRGLPGVVRCVLNYATGDTVPPSRSSMDRAGHVIVCGPDAASRDATLDEVVRRLRLITQEP